MKHIDKYNKFIKLNEDIQIEGNICEYDINIIKDGLIELGDLGFLMTDITKYEDDSSIDIRLETDSYSSKISKDIECVYRFNKAKIYSKTQEKTVGRKFYPYTLTKYEKNIFNKIKDCSLFLLNILDYDNGYVSIAQSWWTSSIYISLNKNKTE